MTNVPILSVQYQRDLPDGRIVVSGPSYGGPSLHWTSGNTFEVRLLHPCEPVDAITGILSSTNPMLLSTSEQLGFDPFSSECPTLRELQNYTSAMIAGLKAGSNLLGLVMLPATARVRFARCRIRLALPGWEPHTQLLSQELAHVQDHEHFILRWESQSSEGFLLFSAKRLSSSLSTDCEGTLVLPLDDAEVTSGRLFCMRPYRQTGTRRTEYREVHVGDYQPLP